MPPRAQATPTFGISVAKCCRLRVTDVVAGDNEVAGVQAIRLSDGYVGVHGGLKRLKRDAA